MSKTDIKKGDQVQICITKGGGMATVVRTTFVGAMTTKGFYLFNDLVRLSTT